MKKIAKYTAIAALAIGFAGCNDSFLDKAPTTTISEVTAFESYKSTQAYMWPCYAILYNTTIATSPNDHGYASVYNGDRNAGYFSNRTPGGYNAYAFQTVAPSSSGNGWDFGWIYHINIMLKGLETSSMPTAEKEHWQAVGYFFHAFWYMELINRFGDVPWIDKVLDTDTDEPYGPRTPRDEVANNILTRLKWAEEHIGNFEEQDGRNAINQACVQMALSRFTLREGTWRKYHGLNDADKYLTECVRVSKELINKYPELYTGTDGQPAAGYGELWTSPSLANVPGVILYREYKTDFLTSMFNFRERNDQAVYQLSQDMADMYLTKNGLPITNAQNTQYKGASKDIYDIFTDRDPRMYHTVTPPYSVIQGGTDKPAENPNCSWGYDTRDPKYRKFIDIMGADVTVANPGKAGQMKRLPISNWNAGNLIKKMPNLRGDNGPCSTASGYYLWKNYNGWELSNNNSAMCDSDKPIFKVEEAILNYAEAACELGQFDQAAADISINRLRKRAGVADMEVAKIDASFDPNRDKGNNPHWSGEMPDYEVEPLLWKIRRERIVELMGEGFGFYDVRRWAKAPYFINRQEKGMWWSMDDPLYTANTNGILNTKTGLKDETLREGYIYVQPSPKVEGKGWIDKYYLYCVPTEQLLLNKNLTQNPGWPTVNE